MVVQNSVITLEDLRMEHLDQLTEIASHPDFFYPYLHRLSPNNPAEGAQKYCELAETVNNEPEQNSWIKGIFNENKQLIGVCVLVEAKPIDPDDVKQGLEAEIGYFIKAEEQHKGYASWAARLMTEWGHERHNICALRATVDPAFSYSIAILKQLGLHQTGDVAESDYTDKNNNLRPRLMFHGPVNA